jgi:hypothetical protein
MSGTVPQVLPGYVDMGRGTSAQSGGPFAGRTD